MVRAICGILLIDRKRAKDFVLMSGLHETMAVFVGVAMC